MKSWKHRFVSVIACLVLLTGCAFADVVNRDELSPEDFEQAMTDAGLEIQDHTEEAQESLEDVTVNSCLVAIGSATDSEGIEVTYTIEYYQFANRGQAVMYYLDICDELEIRADKLRNSSYTHKSAGNYNIDTYKTEVTQSIVSQVGATVVYSDVFNTDISEPKEIIGNIGYK